MAEVVKGGRCNFVRTKQLGIIKFIVMLEMRI